MGTISSIHIAKGHVGEFFHNSREKPTRNSIGDKSKNEVTLSAKEALKLYHEKLKKRSEAYTKRTGQKLQKKAITLMSAVVNIKSDTTMSELKRLGDKLEKELGTKILQIAIHRDEGHVSEAGELVINQHAHIMMMGLDSEGRSIKRKLSFKMLRELQDITAQTLKMERGQKRKLGERKRLDTYQFKQAMSIKNQTEKELKKQIKSLQNNETLNKKTIQRYIRNFEENVKKYVNVFGNISKDDVMDLFAGFLQSFKTRFDKLKEENKKLKKDLDDMQQKAFERWQTINSQKEEIAELKAEVEEKNKIINQIKELDSVKLARENHKLKLTVKQLKDEISALRKQMIHLNKELQAKDENPLFDREDYQYLSKLKRELKADTVEQVYNKVVELKQKVRSKSQNFGIDF